MLPITYSVIVPVFNSSAIVSELVKRIVLQMEKLNESFEIILTDDCSSDNVWEIICNLCSGDKRIKGCRLSNNFGQWMATMAGISRSSGKYIITIDDDLEYDPSDIPLLIDHMDSGGYYLVFGLASEKYIRQGKNKILLNIRNRILNTIWQKFITDSFKIFKRELLFNGNKFAPRIHFEAFINFSLHKQFVGYCEVDYNQRFEGSSNHTLFKKISMFFQYSIDYYRYPSKGLSAALAFMIFAGMTLEYVFFRGELNGLLIAIIGFSQIVLLLILLQYAAHIYLRTRKVPEFWIIEEVN